MTRDLKHRHWQWNLEGLKGLQFQIFERNNKTNGFGYRSKQKHGMEMERVYLPYKNIYNKKSVSINSKIRHRSTVKITDFFVRCGVSNCR